MDDSWDGWEEGWDLEERAAMHAEDDSEGAASRSGKTAVGVASARARSSFAPDIASSRAAAISRGPGVQDIRAWSGSGGEAIAFDLNPVTGNNHPRPLRSTGSLGRRPLVSGSWSVSRPNRTVTRGLGLEQKPRAWPTDGGRGCVGQTIAAILFSTTPTGRVRGRR